MRVHLDRKQFEQLDGGAIAFVMLTLFIIIVMVY
jgi:hypothetical protein